MESAWTSYKRMGEGELRDLEDGLKWLESQPYVDSSRILLSGWSYGGFMTLYAMTHSKSWAAGIVGAPVTDWRDYDSIYTERYMLMPQNNPDGYRKSSPRFDVDKLHGNVFFIHGTTDDNVHVQNTVQVAWALQQLGRPFEMMLLPRAKHSVREKKTVAFLQKTILGFVQRQLLAAPSQNPGS
jgi:dipeptidyl aminopeptidase/acylaminoacyl peptidase